MSKTVEIRWHGRGGQGAKTACLLLADAAFSSGKYVQGFPEYGPERMGAPITAYNRISDERHAAYVGQTLRCLIDGVDEQDPSLLTARTDGNRLVRLPGDAALVGSFRPVTITASGTWSLSGRLAD